MASGVTEQALSRLTHIPGNTNNPNAELIAAQKYYDVEFTGGQISNVTLTDVIIDGDVIGNLSVTGTITAGVAVKAPDISDVQHINFYATGSTNTVHMQPDPASTAWTLVLPPNDGNSTDVLQTSGAGVTTWVQREVPLTFSTGLTRTTNTVTVNTSQNITKLSNLTSNGFVKTSAGDGTLSVDTASYQPLDATLTALAAYNTNGILTQTAADTFTGRTITGTANQVIVTNGNGVSGNPTLTTPQDIATGSSPTFNALTLTTSISAATATGAVVATQANMETATATNVLVSPGRQQFHPGHPKAIAVVTQSAGNYTLVYGFNVTSVTKNSTGDVNINLTTAMSSTSYGAVITMNTTGLTSSYITSSTSVLEVLIRNLAAVFTDSGFTVSIFGDQ